MFLCSRAVRRGDVIDLHSIETTRRGTDTSAWMLACFPSVSPTSVTNLRADLGRLDGAEWVPVAPRGGEVPHAEASIANAEPGLSRLVGLLTLPAFTMPTGWYAWRVRIEGDASWFVPFRAAEPAGGSLEAAGTPEDWYAFVEPDLDPTADAHLLLCQRSPESVGKVNLIGCYMERTPVLEPKDAKEWALGGVAVIPGRWFEKRRPRPLEIELQLSLKGKEIERDDRRVPVTGPIDSAPHPWETVYMPIRLELPPLNDEEPEGEYLWSVAINGDLAATTPFTLRSGR